MKPGISAWGKLIRIIASIRYFAPTSKPSSYRYAMNCDNPDVLLKEAMLKELL
jgi:hypothetical protein